MKISNNNYNTVDYKNLGVKNSEAEFNIENSENNETKTNDKVVGYNKDKPLYGTLKTNFDVGDGEARVYKPYSYDEKNPSIFVKGKNVDGTEFESLIYINDINPKNMSYVEALAIEGYTAIENPKDQEKFCGRLCIVSTENSTDYFKKEDYFSSFSDLVSRQLDTRNYTAYNIFSKDLAFMKTLLK